MEKRLASFLAVSSGYCYGDGDGSGYGSGYGDGYGYGSGYGSGYSDGDGSGDGDGYGYGSGITSFCGKCVHKIDNVPTIIDSVHGNYANGSILNSDFTLTPCYVAKVDNSFAHGSTLQQAFADAQAKALQVMPLEQRISRFKEAYPSPDKKIPAEELFRWHNTLTGSCLMGRKQFCEERNLDYENGQYTVREFIQITKDAYGGDAIRQLAQSYNIPLPEAK